ncbi:MAG: DUF1574 family protein [Saprospiraceae bacterium]|nr:DUF1574 family protein [Saprospiraceae bacterium]
MRHTKSDMDEDRLQYIFEDNVLVLNSIIKWCRGKNVKVVLVMLPAYETYRYHLDAEQLRRTVEESNQIASEHDNCIYLNLLEDGDFIAEDFFDADHLSEIGAKKLSSKLNDLIVGWKS